VIFRRIPERIHIWDILELSGLVRGILQEGLRFQCFFHGKNPVQSHKEKLLLRHRQVRDPKFCLKMKSLVQDRVIKEVPVDSLSSRFVLHAFPVPKPHGKIRVTLDFRPLNKFMHAPHFKMEDIRVVCSLVEKGDFMTKIDLTSAYWHIPLSATSAQLVNLWFEDRLWEFQCMPFGLNIAPLIFTKMTRPMLNHLRFDHLFRTAMYLDDLWHGNGSYEVTYKSTRIILHFLRHLGWVVREEKCVLTPTQKLLFLGFIIDSISMMLFLSDDRVSNVRSKLKNVLHRHFSGKLTLRQLASALGVVRACGPAIQNLGAKILETQVLVSTASRENLEWDAKISLPLLVSSELSVCIQNLRQWNGRTFLTFEADVVIVTDASEHGWGAKVVQPHVCFRETGGTWTLSESKLHINELEIMAFGAGLQALAEANNFINLRLLTYIDNLTAQSYLKRRGGRKPYLARKMRAIVLWAEERGLVLDGEYIPSEENIADGLSRSVIDSCDYRLKQSVFQVLEKIWGSFDIDLFASRANKKLDRFVSYTPQPGALFIDAFSSKFCWSELGFCYIYCPFSLISRVLQRIVRERVEAVMILPFWPAAPWWSSLARVLIEEPRWLPSLAFEFPGTLAARVNFAWKSICVRVSGSRYCSSISRGTLLTSQRMLLQSRRWTPILPSGWLGSDLQ